MQKVVKALRIAVRLVPILGLAVAVFFGSVIVKITQKNSSDGLFSRIFSPLTFGFDINSAHADVPASTSTEVTGPGGGGSDDCP